MTGIDFVRAQIEIARGAEIGRHGTLARRDGLRGRRGHAIEVRVYAENPAEGFLPSPGRDYAPAAPAGPGIRDDSGAFEGWTVPTAYDPLISKVIAWAPDRRGAIARMVRALTEYDVRGISTTIGVLPRPDRHRRRSPPAEFDTTYVDRLLRAERERTPRESDALEEIAAIAGGDVREIGNRSATSIGNVCRRDRRPRQ